MNGKRLFARIREIFTVGERFRARLHDILSVLMTFGYMCLFLAGVASIISTPATIENASHHWQAYVWSSFLIVGGAMSASDIFTGLRGGEVFGTPFIAGALFLWGAALLWREWHNPGLAGAGTVLAWVLFGFTLVMVARFIMMTREFRAVRAASTLG